MDSERVASETREWIERVVVGLDLCPFATEPLRAGRLRVRVSDARDPEGVADALVSELRHLDREPVERLETSLLVLPLAFPDFDEFNRFLAVCEDLLARLGLLGAIQIASFHPDYRFEGVPDEDVANATNRSPYPMLHLLREASVERAVRGHPDPEGIPGRNAQRLRSLGWEGLRRHLGGER